MKHSLRFIQMQVMILLLLLGGAGICRASNINVLSPLIQERVAAVGTSYNGSIVIENSGKTPCRVQIYQTDYLYYADGRSSYGVLGENPASNGNWVTSGSNWLTVPAQGKATVHYKVEVPPNPALQGSYWSMLMVEAADDQPIAGGKNQGAVALRTKLRYGVQVITNIGNTGSRQIRFLDRKISNEGGQRILQLDIENSGERSLNPVLSLQLFNARGELIGNCQGGKFRILPTCSVRQRINLPALPRGNYKALVIVDNGDQYVFGANYDLVIEK
ncbi:MAG TPA: hypothetical protein DDZ55_10085 [Firmicutes bacterium]|nr:hypothetical protein [Bacillota bacterium]